ncbi:MAG: hypothetical protein QF561_03070 [Phycisphaerales bacterium]|jgi:hypothetical protein|nr:hypothetical protein [Phycisphaerales bacterium]
MAIVIAAIAAARCLVVLLPETWFDVDPVLDPYPAIGLAPHELMVLDALLLLAASFVFFVEGARARGGSTLLLVLWIIPAPLCLLWAAAGGHHGQVALPWMAGAAAAVALAHACRDQWTRRVVVAILVSVAAPIALRALAQWGWDNPDTAAWFAANRDEALAMLGLDPGSSAARVYERRLLEGTPTGWFTSANLLATVMAAAAVTFGGLTFAAQRQGRTAWVGGVLFVACVASVGVVGLSGSVAGMTLLVAAAALTAIGLRRRAVRDRGGWVAVIMVVSVTLIPLAAGGADLLFGDQALRVPGGRSAMIRWQYDIGAARLIAASPLGGVGPAGFQDAYAGVRVAGAPEEITSPHSMALGWVSTIGVAGLSWAAMVFVLLWRAGTVRWKEDEPSTGGLGTAAAIGALLAIVPAAMVMCRSWDRIDEASQTVRILGWSLMPLLAWVSWRSLRGDAARWAVLMAVALLLAQAQIDMSLEASSTVVWVLAMLGAAGARFKKRGRGVPMCGGVLCGGLAVVVVAIIVVPWWRQDRLVAQAARVLVQAPGDAGGLADALVRGEASSMIRDAWQTQRDPRLLGHVASQQLAAASDAAASPAFAAVHLGEAARAGAEAMAAGSIAGGRLAIVALAARSDLAGERQWLQSALAMAERVVLADPNAAMSWVTLARLAERSGELDRAARAWRRAIEIDDANTLDPAQRLPEAIRDEASAIAPPEQRPLHP